MEYQELKFLKKLFQDHSKSIVGRLCKQNELVRDNKNLIPEQKLDILKAFNRELVYESFRDLLNHIKCYNNGHNDVQQYKIYKKPSGQ